MIENTGDNQRTLHDSGGSPRGEATTPDGDGPRAAWRIGQFTVLRRLGAGGMGVVFAAYDDELDRRVALKLLRPDLRRGHEAGARLLREAQALARLSHPNVVQVYEVGKLDGQVFIAMEYIAGADGRAWMAASPRGWQETLAAYVQAGMGLAAAHRAGLVHRDFKPDNILIGADGRVCVVDFGLVRSHESLHDLHPEHPTHPTPHADVALTATNTTLGTPAYMSPEQHLLRPVDAHSDQYSFCVALYEALYRVRPFVGHSTEELRQVVLSGQRPPPPPRSEVPSRIHRALLRGLAFAPADRWPSMDALLAELTVKPVRGWAIALGLVMLMGVALGSVLIGARSAERCTGAGEHIATVWNEARRGELQAGFLRTNLPFARHAAARAAQAFDDYAAAWAAQATAACEAHHRGEHSDAVFDRQTRCLERRRSDLGALAAALADADGQIVEKGVQAASSLPPLSGCADVETLMDLPAPPPELATAIEDIRAELGRARASLSVGAHAAAHERSVAALTRARALQYPPLIAETQMLVADTEQEIGQYDAALVHGSEAFELALAHTHDLLATRLAIGQIFRASRTAQLATGETWARVARALLARQRAPASLRVEFHRNLGALYRKSDPRRALESYRQALALADNDPEVSPSAQRPLYINMGNLLLDLDDFNAARASFERALALAEPDLGPDHPAISSIRNGLAGALKAAGDLNAAEAEYRRAIDLCGRARGPMHPICGSIVGNLAQEFAEQGRFAEARPLMQRSLQIAEAQHGSNHPAIAAALHNMGCLLLDLDEPAAAHAMLRRALTLQERAAGPDSVDGSYFMSELGRAEVELGRPGAARPLLERALSLRERLDLPAEDIADTRFQLARALAGVPGERARAIALATIAEAVLRDRPRFRRLHADVAAWLAQPGARVHSPRPPP